MLEWQRAGRGQLRLLLLLLPLALCMRHVVAGLLAINV